MAFWVTYHVNNPIGAVLAWLFYHVRLTPNVVSLISLVVTLLGPTLLCFWHPNSPITEALIIVVSLQLGYTLDGADGMLARATKQGSRFGYILDKLIDALIIFAVPPLLYFASGHHQPAAPFGDEAILIITFLAITSRGMLATHLWLKEFVERGAARDVFDTRKRTLAYYVRRGGGQTTDTSTFYFAIAIAWATGGFWWLMFAYSIWTTLIWLGYLWLSYRDLR